MPETKSQRVRMGVEFTMNPYWECFDGCGESGSYAPTADTTKAAKNHTMNTGHETYVVWEKRRYYERIDER